MTRVVLFDGVCALCDSSVRALLAIDKKRRLSFAPLQGTTAEAVLGRHPETDRSLSTILYVRKNTGEDEVVFERSDACFEILRDMGGFWSVLAWLRWLPRPVRDLGYRFIATRRYRWFGKLDACRLPNGDVDAARFLP